MQKIMLNNVHENIASLPAQKFIIPTLSRLAELFINLLAEQSFWDVNHPWKKMNVFSVKKLERNLMQENENMKEHF